MNQLAVELGFKAFDLHELFPHFVARELGFYRDAGLEVSLRDTTFIPESDWPRHLFSTACGGATLSWLAGGDQRILLGAIRGPLFWLVTGKGSDWETLRGTRIASFPFMAPPHVFLRILFREKNLDPDQDLQLEPVRDDAARWGLLREGEVSAALLSSNMLPSEMKNAGFEILACLADHLHLPTAGLSVKTEGEAPSQELRQALAVPYREALKAIHGGDSRVPKIQEKWLPGITPDYAEWMRSLYVVDNAYDPDPLRDSLTRLARELGEDPPESVDGLFTY